MKKSTQLISVLRTSEEGGGHCKDRQIIHQQKFVKFAVKKIVDATYVKSVKRK